ncbi:MAG: hypothetical protein P8170_09755 [Gemmatimonadota bacterium]
MARVIVASHEVSSYPEGAGHFWVYMQYIQGLQRAGCEVYWLEQFHSDRDQEAQHRAIATFLDRARSFGLEGRTLLYRADERGAAAEWIGVSRTRAEATLRSADLLLNFHYEIHPSLLGLARRTALVDIDPGLLQLWMSTEQLSVAQHDVYFTIGETVGTPQARFPDCGVRWLHIRPPVNLELWPFAYDPDSTAFTTVSGWWSGLFIKVVENGQEVLRENTKRVAILPYAELPHHTSQRLELALHMSDDDVKERHMLEERGWSIRDALDIAGTPDSYRAYIQASRGEWAAAKPSCIRFQNAWVSDRTVCYLASGKPVVVQDTGPSSYLPDGEGMFRFATLEEAAEAFEAVNADYARQCRAARDLAETHFDAHTILPSMLNEALP